MAELQRAWGHYERALAAVRLSDAVVRQRRPARLLGESLANVLMDGALLVPNLFGWANGLVPRWAAHIFGPLGREHPKAAEPSQGIPYVVVAREALWGTLAGWVSAAVAFPLQTFLVYHWGAAAWGRISGGLIAGIYLVSLIPSWRLYVRRRDFFRKHLIAARDSFRFLIHAVPATRVQGHRRRIVTKIRSLVAAYEAAAPRPDR